MLAAAAQALGELEAVIDAIPASERDTEFGSFTRDRDVADVLNHLHAWHVVLLRWLAEASAGLTPEVPAPGYRWGDLDALNLVFRDGYAREGVAAAHARLRASHDELLTVVGALDDDALFTEGHHAWLGGTLAEPVHECLGAHYDWAIGAIAAARGSRHLH